TCAYTCVSCCCLISSDACKSEICWPRDCEDCEMLVWSSPRMPLLGSVRPVRIEEILLAKPELVPCGKLCTAEKLLESVEASVLSSTLSVPSLLRLTPRLARLTMPLLDPENVTALSSADCASRSEPSASSGPPPGPSGGKGNCGFSSLMAVLYAATN